MEDYKIDFTAEAGMHARTMTLRLNPFTLIGATTRIGLLTGPMRSRFGITEHIEFYSPELEAIQDAMAAKYKFELTSHVLRMIGICLQCRQARASREKNEGTRAARSSS